MLFRKSSFFSYKFPCPQYLGAKYILLNWLKKYFPKRVNIALDAFSGSQSVAYLMKQLGYQVITNDFLSFNHQIGKALIENGGSTLNKSDINKLFEKSSQKEKYTLIEKEYTSLFFEKEESVFLDNYRANIDFLDDTYKKHLALAIMNRSIQRKITMGHFAHAQALNYAHSAERVRRNPNLTRSLKTIFFSLLTHYNDAIFDNKKENKSFSENILALLSELLEEQKIDFIYIDPPYCNSHSDYQSFYHLLETYTEYWHEKKFINSIKRYEPQRFSGFDKKRDVVKSFYSLFEYAQEIPYWLISYNDRSFPTIKELKHIISKYKNVEVAEKVYIKGRGGKGSVKGSKEILFICFPKSKFSFLSI